MMKSMKLVVGMLAAMLLMGACESGTGVPAIPGTVSQVDESEKETMLNRHNATRTGMGLDAYTRDADLDDAAALQAKYMAEQGKLSHEDGNGDKVDTRATAAGYNWLNLGENIGFNSSAQALYQGWLGSAGHYNNITSNTFQEVGIGGYSNGIQTYWCIVFGNPVP